MDLAPYAAAAPKSGGHWYHPDGRACHTVPYASGKGDRNTTLADARKMGLYPSVTAVLGPPKGLDHVDAQVLKDAADQGEAIHGAIESYYLTGDHPEEYDQYVAPVVGTLAQLEFRWQHSELRVVNTDLGYAGTCDMLGTIDGDARDCAIDFKTRRSNNGKFHTYSSEPRQLAAYAVAEYGDEDIPGIVIANVYISTNEPGVVKVVVHKDTQHHFNMFLHALALWRDDNNYDPRTRTL